MNTNRNSSFPIKKNSHAKERYMAESLPIRRKTVSN